MINKSTQKATITPKRAQFFPFFESLKVLRSVFTVGLVAAINTTLLLVLMETESRLLCLLTALKIQYGEAKELLTILNQTKPIHTPR